MECPAASSTVTSIAANSHNRITVDQPLLMESSSPGMPTVVATLEKSFGSSDDPENDATANHNPLKSDSQSTFSLLQQDVLNRQEDETYDEETTHCSLCICLGDTEGLLIFLVVLCVVLIGILSGLLVLMKESAPVCSSKPCVVEAGRHLQRMNLSAKPCDDFYNYACGLFLQRHSSEPVTAFSARYLASQVVTKRVLRQLTNPINSTFLAGRHSVAVELAQIFLQSCLDVQRRLETNYTSLDNLVDLLGGWRLVGRDSSGGGNAPQDQGLVYLLAQSIRVSGNSLLRLSLDVNPYNSKAYMIHMSGPESLVSGHLLLSDSPLHRTAFREYFVEFVRILKTGNVSSIPSVVSTLADRVWDVERNISALYAQLENTTSVPTARYQVSRLDQVDPHISKDLAIDLRYLLQLVYDTKDISPAESIVLVDEIFLKRLGAFWKTVEDEVKEAYLMIHSFHQLARFLDFYTQMLKDNFLNTLGAPEGENGETPTCLHSTSLLFPEVVSALYTDKYITRSARLEATSLTNRVKKELKNALKKFSWMDSDTQAKAISKWDKITVSVAHAVNAKSVATLDAKLQPLVGHLSLSSSVLQNYVQVMRYSAQRNFTRLQEKVSVENYVQLLPLVKANFLQAVLHLEVDVGILQYPYFHEDFSEAHNYGSLGSELGHYLAQGFDASYGSYHDADGNLRDWWSNTTRSEYRQIEQCFMNQYHNNSLDRRDGHDSVAKIMTESLGLEVAHRAFQRFNLAKAMQAVRLPGMTEVSMEQLFFISYAQHHCTQYHSHIIRSPAEMRVLGTLSNSKAFTKAFQCHHGDKYRPDTRCLFW